MYYNLTPNVVCMYYRFTLAKIILYYKSIPSKIQHENAIYTAFYFVYMGLRINM